MRVVFLGTPTFAVPALQSLIDHSHEICAVFTQPDRPTGRGHKLKSSPVKDLSIEQGIRVFQPEKIGSSENRAIFEELQPDFIVVVAYGQILPGWLLEAARFEAINIHASLLPFYRGAAPIPWAILSGEVVTGVTTMIMEEELDSGPILLQKAIPIPIDQTAGELAETLSRVGANLLIETLDGLRKNTLNASPQDADKISWAPRMTKEMALISWGKRALDVHNQIRAMNPWPVAYTVFRGERLQLLRSMPEEGDSRLTSAPGSFLGLSRNGLRVQCGEGTVIELLELKMPGRSRVTGREFASGARLNLGESLKD